MKPDEPLATDGVYSFTLEDRTEILIQCANYTHYYEAWIICWRGNAARHSAHGLAPASAYGAACFGTLTLGLFHLVLWLRRRGRAERLLGVLCLACAGWLCYPFLHSLGVPAVRLTYALEDACAGVVLLCTVLLAGLITGTETRRFHRCGAVPVAASLCAARVVFPLFILPYAPDLITCTAPPSLCANCGGRISALPRPFRHGPYKAADARARKRDAPCAFPPYMGCA